jgi:hypothetical protein
VNVLPTSVELPGRVLRTATRSVLNHLVTKVWLSKTGPSIGVVALDRPGGNGPLTIAAQP